MNHSTPVLGKSKKEVVTEFRTAEILEAARKVFARKGFHDATMDDVAEAAGIAKGTLYIYYSSKRAIYWAALEQGIVTMHGEMRQTVEAAETTPEKIRAFIASKLTYFERNREFFKIYFSEFGSALTHPAEVHKRFKNLYFRQARVLEAALLRAMKRKEIPALRAGTAALAISDLTRGMIIQRLLGWSKAQLQDDISFVFNLVWHGISGR